MDTGVGVSAYSIIEQGQIDQLLQASTVDRRVIFEEAAGISKFKAHKKEALRKLERTEQNLLRLADIVGEVQKQLRSIKLQAGKARNLPGLQPSGSKNCESTIRWPNTTRSSRRPAKRTQPWPSSRNGSAPSPPRCRGMTRR